MGANSKAQQLCRIQPNAAWRIFVWQVECGRRHAYRFCEFFANKWQEKMIIAFMHVQKETAGYRFWCLQKKIRLTIVIVHF